MTGRHGAIDLNVEVARAVREAAGDALVVAEHAHDFRADLVAGGWDGTMNYSGFLRPAWSWLRAETLPEKLRASFWSMPVGLPRLAGGDAPSRRCAPSAPASRGRPSCTPGRSSTATTSPASAPSRARARATSSGSACR